MLVPDTSGITSFHQVFETVDTRHTRLFETRQVGSDAQSFSREAWLADLLAAPAVYSGICRISKLGPAYL